MPLTEHEKPRDHAPGIRGKLSPSQWGHGAIVRGLPQRASTPAILTCIRVKEQEKENQIRCVGGGGCQDLKM